MYFVSLCTGKENALYVFRFYLCVIKNELFSIFIQHQNLEEKSFILWIVTKLLWIWIDIRDMKYIFTVKHLCDLF